MIRALPFTKLQREQLLAALDANKDSGLEFRAMTA